MPTNALAEVFLPVALATIMLGLGLGLTRDDFRRVVLYPRAVFVGLTCQMLVLPAVCFGIATALRLRPEFAVGLMLVAASPGGATANLFSHLARGDVALNVTLTAVNSVLSLATLPAIVNLSVRAFMGEDASLPLVLDKVLQVFAVVLVPVAIGMVVRARAPARADRLSRPVKGLSIAFLLIIVVASITREQANVRSYLEQIGPAALAFNLTSLLVGYTVPRLARIAKDQAIAIGMEIGLHNGALAIAIASSPRLLNNRAMAVPAGIYSLIMFFTAAIFAVLVRSPSPAAAPDDAA